jgi:hypothetical protein
MRHHFLTFAKAVLWVNLGLMAACTDKPKIERAGVGEPTATPTIVRSQIDSKNAPPEKPESPSSGTAEDPKTSSDDKETKVSGSSEKPSEKDAKPADSEDTKTTRSDSPADTVSEKPQASGNAVFRTDGVFPTAQDDLDVLTKECEEKKKAIACMRVGFALQKADKKDQAAVAYKKACLGGSQTPPAACAPSTDPMMANPRACFEVATLVIANAKDEAKLFLKCGCDMNFELACLELKALWH